MTTYTFTENNTTHHSLIQALIDEGWNGKWYINNNYISIDNTQGSLFSYLTKCKYLNYNDTLQLALDLGTQIIALAKQGKGLVTIDPKNIIVCQNQDSSHCNFIISDLSQTFSLNINTDCLEIITTLPLSEYMAPEVHNIDVLPKYIHISAIYYSIALLCLKCLGISKQMREIYGSKLYFFLQRCLRTDPHTREFLYI